MTSFKKSREGETGNRCMGEKEGESNTAKNHVLEKNRNQSTYPYYFSLLLLLCVFIIIIITICSEVYISFTLSFFCDVIVHLI